MEKDRLSGLKRTGLQDSEIGSGKEIAEERLRHGILPTYKMVDTCSAEFDAETPYYYSTYESEDETCCSPNKKVIILGSGPIRIGQGIEFDCCTVHAVFALKEMGIESIVVNSNPETVSTDFDISDKLYFEPITFEDVANIVEKERDNLLGVMVQFGGQTAINLAIPLHEHGIDILGTSPEDIDRAENRDLFGKILDKLEIPSAAWGTAYSFKDAKDVASRIGYPVLVRPSYVLGGRAMEIVQDDKDLEEYIKEAARVSPKHPILIDKFLDDALEVDVDIVCDGETVLIGAIMEHIEEAGIHSGDSACVIPPQNLKADIIATIKDYSTRLALELNVKGLLNIQYAIKDNIVYMLEANPRASRTVPFVSKAVGVHLAKLAAKVMVGEKLKDLAYDTYPMEKIRHVAVKEVVFPFTRFPHVDPILSPEMKSTGEVMGIDNDFQMAYYKAQIAAGNRLPLHGTVFISVKAKDKTRIIDLAKKFDDLGFNIIATPGTSDHLTAGGITNRKVYKISEGSPNVLDLMRDKQIDLIINTPSLGRIPKKDGYKIRISAVEMDMPYITTLAGACAAVKAIKAVREREVDVKSLNEYFS